MRRIDMAESNPVSKTLSTLQSAYGLAKGIADLEQAHAIKSQIADLMDQILSARESAMRSQERETSLLGEVDGLKKQIDKMKTWDTNKERYCLQAVDTGAFAYVLKPNMQGDEPPHWLCANCFEKGQKSFLQFKEQLRTPTGSRDNRSRWICATCRAEITVYYSKKPV